jgi:hypothetical protein
MPQKLGRIHREKDRHRHTDSKVISYASESREDTQREGQTQIHRQQDEPSSLLTYIFLNKEIVNVLQQIMFYLRFSGFCQ